MAVTPRRFADLYPLLFHMAEADSLNSILKHGLLSTSSLLTLFELDGEPRERLEARKRQVPETIEHPAHGRAVLRSQKPITESKLKAALVDCELPDWYRTLNGRVFFWPTVERLTTLLTAQEYRGKPHLVLTLDSLSLTTDYADKVTLSPLNSGNTRPIAHPRGTATFKRMSEYPFDERLKRGPYYTVVELAIDDGVPNIAKYIVRAELMVAEPDSPAKILKTLHSR